jgi:NAD(P)-dependent dehydrogenase (short-subunit alcohol dehydrogenase family)
MKVIITGSLGHTGKPLATELVKKGHTVTVISRNAERQKDIEALGATAAIGSLEDVGFLASAFKGADAVYAMVPPDYTVSDSRAYYRRIGGNYAQAIGQSGIRRVVQLSSWGAHLDKGTGPILGSHDLEGMLGQLAGVAITYVASDERSAVEIARVLGAAIGQPDLKWVTFTDEQVRQALEQRGMPAKMASDLVDLGASIHSGAMGEDYELHKPRVMGKVKLEDFAKEFAAAF